VTGGDLSAQVRTERIDKGDHDIGDDWWWRLDVSLDMQGPPGQVWQLLGASSPSPDVKNFVVNPDATPKAGPRKLSLEFMTPGYCPVEKSREPIVVKVQYLQKGEIRTADLELDYRCLLGDSNREPLNEGAQDLARLMEKYRSDPLIQKLVSRASASGVTPLMPPKRAIQILEDYLKEWIPDGFHYQHDASTHITSGGLWYYAFSPSEVIRFGGGDCEDWAILAGAYLSSLGYETYVANTEMHVWAVVRDRRPKLFRCPTAGGPTVQHCPLETPFVKDVMIDLTQWREGEGPDKIEDIAEGLAYETARVRPSDIP